jgi:peptidoglycan/xylan/chitin deacetylase (PgdA/CDA1 family)
MLVLQELGVITLTASNVPNGHHLNRDEAIVTFDDGYENLLDSAVAVMTELGIKATFFCLAGYLGRRNTWDAKQGRRQRHFSAPQLRELCSLGFEIGSHGMTHRLLTRLNEAVVREELVGSKEILEDATGKEVRCFSYPFGRTDSRIESIAEDAGYERAFGLHQRPSSSGFSIPRTPVYAYDGVTGFRSKLRGTSRWGRNASDRMVSFLSLGTSLWQSLKAHVLE